MTLPPAGQCPGCKSKRNDVVDGAALKGGANYRRRRCLDCGRRWSTYESVLNPLKLKVLKRHPAQP